MNINTAQRNAMIELVSMSANARSIVQRLDPALVQQADIEELRRTIISLSDKIAQLTEQLDDALHPEAQFTDEDAHEFSTALMKTLEPMNYRVIVSVYDREYMRHYPKNIRVLICTALKNTFQKRGLNSPQLWDNVLASNGSI